MNKLLSQDNVLIVYKGPFIINVLSNLGNYIRQYATNEQTESKLYKIFIELSQNVARYSAERKSIDGSKKVGIGSIVLENTDDSFKLTTSNLILKEQGPILHRNCENINKLNKDELRTLKSSKRVSPECEKNCAHIGIIQIGILSSNKLHYEIEVVNQELDRFTISSIIKKNY